MFYELLKKNPVAKFYYKGNHTHPVRRTVLLIESNRKWIRGYELREGMEQRNIKNAPIKTYRRNRIAKYTQLDNRSPKRMCGNKSTLVRTNYVDLILYGV